MSLNQPRPILHAVTDSPRVVELMDAPINKVGLILLRQGSNAEPQVCLVQVKAKNPAEQAAVKFGPAKGTRQYRDALSGEWRDARDQATAVQQRDALEPLIETVRKESSEEIGVAEKDFARSKLYELGARDFVPRDQGAAPYPIQWFVMEADARMLANMDPHPADAHAVKWFNESELHALENSGSINVSYPPVIREAVQKFRENALTPVTALTQQR